jgi:hypothetical protein
MKLFLTSFLVETPLPYLAIPSCFIHCLASNSAFVHGQYYLSKQMRSKMVEQ